MKPAVISSIASTPRRRPLARFVVFGVLLLACIVVTYAAAAAPSTTLGNGVAGTTGTVCPGAASQKLDGFTFINSAGTNPVTALTVTTTNQAAIASMQIWNEAGTTQYFATVANPGSNTWNFSGGTSIPVSTPASNFKILVTYQGQVTAPAGSTATTANVTSFTTANNTAGTDTADTTLTLDNAAATAATWGTNTPGNASITLNWTLGTGGDSVMIVRYTPNTDTTMPTEGTVYTVGSAFGTGGTIRYVGTGTTVTDNTGLTNGTTYYYRIFEYEGCTNYATTASWSAALTPAAATTTTLGNGVAGTTSTVCPATTSQKLDGFSFVNSAGANPVTALTVTTTNQAAIASMQIWNEGGTTQYFATVANPGSNTWNFSGGTSITVGTTASNFKVLVTYQGQATAPAGNTATTANVTSFTSLNTVAGTDTADTTLTLDNAAATAATWGANSAGSASVTLNWTLGTGGDSVMIVRYTTNTDTTMPTEGNVYVVGNAFGTGGTVRYVGTGSTTTDNTVTNGTTYYYRIFEYEGCTNYATTAPWSAALTPAAVENRVTTSAPTATANSCTQVVVSAPYTTDANGNSITTVKRGTAAAGPFSTTVCSGLTGASPRSCTDNTVSPSTTYYYEVTLADAEGVLGTNPRVTGAVTTPSCSAPNTTPGAVTAVISSCRQITVTAPFTGDGDGDGWIAVEYNITNTWPGTISCAKVMGTSPRQCLVTGLSPSTSYYTRTTFNDPDGMSGGQPQQQVTGPHAMPACGADAGAPTITIMAPARDAVVGGTERVKVAVWDAVGLAASSPVQWAIDGGTFSTTVTTSPRYSCGAGCTVYEFAWNTTALTTGDHSITVKAVDAAGNDARLSWNVVVRNTFGKPSGGGNLLRRTHGSQLCVDCHALLTHSSQATSSKYGNWSVDCVTCHTPHNTTNIYLIRAVVRTLNSGFKAIAFQQDDRAGDTNPSMSYLGQHPGAPTYDDGICESCHTKTTHYRNDTSGGDHTHNQAARCVSCHKHTEGFTGAGCDGCHKGPPSTGKHLTHDQTGTVPSSYTDATNGSTATQYGFACAKCHSGTHVNDTHTGTISDPYRVEIAFDNTTDPKNPAPAAYAQKYPDATDQGTDTTKYWSWTSSTALTDGSCTSSYCHSNAAPVGGTNLYATVRWNQAATLTCASCHNTQAKSDTAVATDLSAAHGRHIQSTAGETGSYDFRCDECHAQTVKDNPNSPWALTAADLADKSKHVAGTHSVNFSGTSIVGNLNQSTGGYAQAPGYTCTNTYCHSTGTTTVAPFGSQTSIAWNATADAECDSCHGGNSVSTTTTGKGAAATNAHTAHMNQSAYLGSNFMCYRCHQDTVVSTGDRAINTLSFHVNAARDVKMSNGGTWTAPSCASGYCHSSGQAVAAPIQYYAPPNWNSGTAMANDCKGCHGRHADNAFTSIAGEPNYTSNGAGATKANDHKKHVDAATDCGDCHNDTSTTGTSIVSNSAKHIDGARDIAISATWDNNGGTKYDNYNAGTKTCSSVRCHVNAGASPVWGGTVTCLNCHGVASGETNDLGTSFWNNGVVATINTTEWTYSGHGKTAGTYDVTANGAAAFPTTPTAGTSECLYCHDDSVYHKQSTNPFRLRGASVSGGATGAYSTAAPNAPCLNCHATSSFGVTPAGQTNKSGTRKSEATHDGSKHSAATLGGKFCWDCHDPHGDRPSITNSGGSNIAMIGRMVRVVQDGTYGYAGASGVERSVEFYNKTAGINSPSPIGRIIESTTAVGTNHVGLCQACHNPTTLTPWTKYWGVNGYDDPDGAGGVAAYKSGVTTGAHHNSTGYCITCHAHKDKFAGKAGGWDCYGCHGSAQGSRRPLSGDFALQSHHVRTNVGIFAASDTTRAAARGTNEDCVVCHMEGQIVTAASADCATGGGGSFPSPCTNPSYHANGKIDLRNVDLAAPPVDGTGTPYTYDKDSVSASAGAAINWSSGNATWRTQTSTALDPFCLSCHDSTGASQINSFRISTEASRTASDPFWDGATNITNNYDGLSRGSVTDIKSKVSGAPPAQGNFARHAIRGQSTSKYTNYLTATAWPSNPNTYSTIYSAGRFTSMGTDENGKPNWNDTSVMGCPDCHTTDGANGTSGNAHGSTSEYLLKDSTGGAAEGSFNGGNASCARCHSNYGTAHTSGSNSDFNDSVLQVGSARLTASAPKGSTGTIFGLACMNCHGGAQGNGAGSGDTNPFGWIHGTSQVFTQGASGGGGTRNAYRFMNGSSLRYYQPGNASWDSGAGTCYTLAAPDSWGNCTQHTGGQSPTTLKRPLTY